jgi:N-acetylglucosamine-6-phosphate deacetylase
VHLDGLTVRMLFDLLGPQRLALVSDAMSAAGLPDGEYVLGGLAVALRGREVRLLEGRSLAGGVSCLLEQVRWCVTELGVSLADAVTAASATPARALALDGVGSLAAGSFADVLVVEADLSRRAVMRRGVWLEPAQPDVPAPSAAALVAGSTGSTGSRGSRDRTGSGGQ